MQRRLTQTKVYHELFYSVWKETSHKPWKVAVATTSFPSVYIMDTTCFDECFLFRVITGRHFLYKLIVTQKFGVTAMLLRSLKQVFWKKSVFHIHYFHNNTAMLLIPQCSYFLHVSNKIYFLIAIFHSFSLQMFDLNVPHFLYKWNF